MALIDELRKAVDQDGRPRRQIALAAGIHPTTFTRFMGGHRGLSVETVEQLALALRLELRLVKQLPVKQLPVASVQLPVKAKANTNAQPPGRKIRG